VRKNCKWQWYADVRRLCAVDYRSIKAGSTRETRCFLSIDLHSRCLRHCVIPGFRPSDPRRWLRRTATVGNLVREQAQRRHRQPALALPTSPRPALEPQETASGSGGGLRRLLRDGTVGAIAFSAFWRNTFPQFNLHMPTRRPSCTFCTGWRIMGKRHVNALQTAVALHTASSRTICRWPTSTMTDAPMSS
jgi:hypothetical protein